MSLDRSARSILAALFLLAALLVAMNRIVSGAPLADWLLPLVLFVLGAAFIPDWDLSRVRSARQPSAQPSNTQTYSISTETTPRPHTMTIRPDPEAAEYHTTVTVTKESSGEEILPFDEDVPSGELLPFVDSTITPAAEETPTTPLSPDSEAPASPETPAPAIVAEPAPDAEPVPVSPETPAPNAPEEPSVASPETPAPAASSAGGDALTRLSGIGQKSAAALAAAGIDTYQKLADSSEESIRAALSAGGVRLVGNVNHSLWSQQAAYAARGDWDGLAQFNAERKSTSED
jgi:predicted flap endonuclease-1-like 5' DNA nuclease